jgi:hypothetical protein
MSIGLTVNETEPRQVWTKTPGGIDVCVVKETKHPTWIERHELWRHPSSGPDTKMHSAYALDGSYIGTVEQEGHFFEKRGITPERIDPGHRVASVGIGPEGWYGWSHRAISSFPTRDEAVKFANEVASSETASEKPHVELIEGPNREKRFGTEIHKYTFRIKHPSIQGEHHISVEHWPEYRSAHINAYGSLKHINALGPANIRHIIGRIKHHVPDLDMMKGPRVSGSRAGKKGNAAMQRVDVSKIKPTPETATIWVDPAKDLGYGPWIRMWQLHPASAFRLRSFVNQIVPRPLVESLDELHSTSFYCPAPPPDHQEWPILPPNLDVTVQPPYHWEYLGVDPEEQVLTLCFECSDMQKEFDYLTLMGYSHSFPELKCHITLAKCFSGDLDKLPLPNFPLVFCRAVTVPIKDD